MESIETDNENIFTIIVNSDSDDNLVKNKLPISQENLTEADVRWDTNEGTIMELSVTHGSQDQFTIVDNACGNKQRRKKTPIKTESSKTFRLNAFYYLQDFTDNVSIAGLKFLGEERRSLPERIFWLIVIIIAITLSSILVYQSYSKWQTSPVIVTFATSPMPIYKIPFPAVTICPETKTVKEKVNFTDIYIKVKKGENITAYESSAYDTLSLICVLERDEINETAYYLNEDRLLFLYEIAPEFFNISSFFWLKRELTRAGANLIPILTSEGICYTFNGLDKSEIFNDHVHFPGKFFKSPIKEESEWTIENGYNENENRIVTYPKRSYLAGHEGGVDIHIREIIDEVDHACGNILKGFKVALHPPGEIPRLSNYFQLDIEKQVVVVVKPSVVTTDKRLNHYSARDRKCYFEKEKKLDFFKVYNQKNCLLECLTKFTLNFCGCVEFYMPRTNSTLICGIALEYCVIYSRGLFLTTKIINNTIGYGKTVIDDENNYKETNRDQCDCLPSCHSISYDLEITENALNIDGFDKIRKAIDLPPVKFEHYLSTLIIYFKDMDFITSERKELYGYTDFWANVGGILGLFTGFSFITLFEILYYLSLRLMCNVKIFGNRFWSGSPNVLDEAESNSKSK